MHLAHLSHLTRDPWRIVTPPTVGSTTSVAGEHPHRSQHFRLSLGCFNLSTDDATSPLEIPLHSLGWVVIPDIVVHIMLLAIVHPVFIRSHESHDLKRIRGVECLLAYGSHHHRREPQHRSQTKSEMPAISNKTATSGTLTADVSCSI